MWVWLCLASSFMHYLDHKNFLHFSRFFAHLSIFHTKRLKKYFANIMSLALFGKLIHTLPRSHYFSAFIKIFSETFPRSHVGYVISLGLCEHGNSVLQFRSAQSFSVPHGMECRLHYKLDYKDYKKKNVESVESRKFRPENSMRNCQGGVQSALSIHALSPASHSPLVWSHWYRICCPPRCPLTFLFFHMLLPLTCMWPRPLLYSSIDY